MPLYCSVPRFPFLFRSWITCHKKKEKQKSLLVVWQKHANTVNAQVYRAKMQTFKHGVQKALKHVLVLYYYSYASLAHDLKIQIIFFLRQGKKNQLYSYWIVTKRRNSAKFQQHEQQQNLPVHRGAQHCKDLFKQARNKRTLNISKTKKEKLNTT